MNIRRALWRTRPKTNRLAYYSFLARRGLGRRDAELEKDVVVEYKGTKFMLEKGFAESSYSVYLDENEPGTFQYMTTQSGNLFVDVGANAGGYTVRLGKKFREVVSVEPNPRAANLLKKNIQLNSLSNITVFTDAISDAAGETSMYVPSSGKTTRSSIMEQYQEGDSFPVHTTTLDSLLQAYSKIDLLKVDAEGAEIRVLRGANMTLRRTAKLVLELGSWSEEEAMKILEEYGFKVSNLDMKVATGRNILAEHAVPASQCPAPN